MEISIFTRSADELSLGTKYSVKIKAIKPAVSFQRIKLIVICMFAYKKQQ